jgi:hypothetical protein
MAPCGQANTRHPLGSSPGGNWQGAAYNALFCPDGRYSAHPWRVS